MTGRRYEIPVFVVAALAGTAGSPAAGVAGPDEAALYVFGSAAEGRASPEGKALSVSIVSPRAGLLFADNEVPDVRARVGGAPGPATVEYSIAQAGGPWEARGTIEFENLTDGAAVRKLPVKFPGRGLYHVTLAGRCGEARSEASVRLGIVFAPAPPDERSRWGVFYIPHIWKTANGGRDRVPHRLVEQYDPRGPGDTAANIRMLGASWVRLNFWGNAFRAFRGPHPELKDGRVVADCSVWKAYARALHREGLHVMGEVCGIPAAAYAKDGTWNKEPDYNLWNPFAEWLAGHFADEIAVWEIWNEPGYRKYWNGTAEQLAEFIARTVPALKRGNPKARIAVAGHDPGHLDFAEKLFAAGAGKHTDIVSVHYTNKGAGRWPRWKTMLDRHKWKGPVWNTEANTAPRHVIPIPDIRNGIDKTFSFTHVSLTLKAWGPGLVSPDFTPQFSGILFSVGAHCLGTAAHVRTDRVGHQDVDILRRGDEAVAHIYNEQIVAKLFAPGPAGVVFQAEALDPKVAPAITDRWGRTAELTVRDGKMEAPLLIGHSFINGLKTLKAVGLHVPSAPRQGVLVVEADRGRTSDGWGRISGSCSERVALIIARKEDPPEGGYWVELDFSVPADGEYELFFSGTDLARLSAPRGVSTFAWSVDGGEKHLVTAPPKKLWGVYGVLEGRRAADALGAVDLKAGRHSFRLELTAPTQTPKPAHRLMFDAIALRRRQAPSD